MKEIRSYRAELRVAEDGSSVIEGYAAKYNVISQDLGGFFEILIPGAFADAVSDDCTCNLEHDDSRLLGRTTSGTLKLENDDVGLRFTVTPPNTETGREAVELLRRGDLNACSFCFDVIEEDWSETEEGLPLRQVRKVKLYDVSVVVFPAYPQTEVALRSLEKWKDSRTTKQIVPTSLRLKKLDLMKKEFNCNR